MGSHHPDKDKSRTLSDTDIVSERKVSKRTLLSALGIGIGVAAAAVLGAVGAASPAEARRVCDSNRGDRCFDVTDRDPYDRPADPYDTR